MKRMTSWLLLLILLSPVIREAKAVDLEIAGKSALLMDVETGTILYAENEHERLAPASVTKVMTMLLIMEAVDSGRIGMEDPVTASEAAAAKGGSQIYLKVGERMSVADMLKSIAVSSANDCACAMAEHLAGSEAAFVEMMNARAEELGMADTHFVNCTGLDDGPNAAEHKTSAHDIAVMSRQLLKYHPGIKQFTTIWMDTVRDGAFGLSNTNKLIRFYDGATGLKTGFTSGAGYCLSASAKREDLELIAVVMGCESSQERTAACKAMLDYGFAGFALVRPELPEETRIPVELGTQDTVAVILRNPEGFLVEKAKRGGLQTRVELAESLQAPVRAGQEVGFLTVTDGTQTLCHFPLAAAENVERLRWPQVFVRVLRKTVGG